MKTLLALITCHNRGAYADAQRETWIPQIPEGLDYRFFLGPSERTPKEDEVFLNCDDSYRGLPNKVQEVVRWAQEHGYDCMAKVDDDVVLKPAAFLNSGFQSRDFTGHINGDKGNVKIPWGFCYTLSKRAMEYVAVAQLPGNNNDAAWVAHTLHYHGIPLHHVACYHLHVGTRPAPSPRSVRAPKRDYPPRPEPPPADAVAYCVYLNWKGYHATPDEENIREFHMLYANYAKGLR